jgi:hypothetical protein
MGYNECTLAHLAKPPDGFHPASSDHRRGLGRGEMEDELVSRATIVCSGFDNQGSDPASPLRPQDSSRRLAEVVAALGSNFSVIFPSLMTGIEQSIVSERRKTFGELIDRVLLCGSGHVKFIELELRGPRRGKH